MELFHFFLIGGVLGPTIYVAICAYSRTKPGYQSIVECAYAGVGLVAGAHLVYCAFVPDALVHVVSLDGAKLPPFEIQVGQIHRVDIAVGSMVLMAFTGGTLGSCFWRALGK